MSRKQIVLLYLAVGLGLLVTTFLVLQRAGVSRSFIENLLAKVIVRDRFRLGDATLNLGDGRLTLDEFAISTPDREPERPLVAVQRVELDVDTNPLGSVGRIRQVRMSGLELDLDLSSGKAPDLAMILEAGEGPDDAPAGAPPAIFIDDASVTLHFAPDAEPIQFTDVDLSLLPEEEAGAPRMILAGSMVSPAGLATRVRGSGNFETNEFRALLEIEDFALDPSLATRFSPAIGEMLAQAELGGTAEQLTMWIEYRQDRPDGDDLVAGVNVDLKDLRGIPPTIRYPLYGASARISASTRNRGSVHFELRDAAAEGELFAHGELTNCFDVPAARIEVDAEGILVSPELRDALCSNPILERIWRSFTPLSGRVDTRFQLVTTDNPRRPRVDLDLELDGVNVDWNGIPTRGGIRAVDFPEQLVNAHGAIHLRGNEVRLDGLEFEACGATSRIDAKIGLDQGDPTTLEFRADEVEFGDRLRAAIESVSPIAAEHYDDYSPSGTAGLHLSVQHANQRDGEFPAIRLKIRPLGASASYRDFPYRVDALRGLIEIEPRGVAFDLEGNHDAATAKLHGRFFLDSDDVEAPLRSELWIDLDGFEIDTELAQAVATLGPELEETWEFLAPKGKADCEFTLWRPQGADEVSYDLRIDARGAEVQLETFPIPVRAIHGPVFVHGTGNRSRIELGVVHGELGARAAAAPPRITAQGEIHVGDGPPTLDVVTIIRDLQLDDQLRDAFDASGAFDAEAWNILAPQGTVDAISRQLREEGDEDVTTQLDIMLRGVESHAVMLPTPATDIRGRVTLRDGVARFRDVRFKMAGCEVLCSDGLSTHDGTATRVEATVSSDDFPIDRNLANLLSGPIRDTYLDRNFEGRVNVHELRLGFVFPDSDASAFSVDLAGRFGVRDLSMAIGARVENMVGSWRIDEAQVNTTGGFVRGRVENAGFSTAGHRVNGAQLDFLADSEHLELTGVSGRIHNGTVFGLEGEQPQVEYQFEGDGRLRAALGWENVSLSSALRAAGIEDSDYRGNLSGKLRIDELIGRDIVHATGSAEVQIRNGKLGAVPMFTAIYSHLSPNRRPRFDAVSMKLELADEQIRVPTIEIESPIVSVNGNGTVSMDGYVDMELDFADLFGTGSDWLVLPRIARFLTSGVVKFQVHGYLRSPRATPQWLWESKPGKLPLGPAPARRR